MLRKISCKLFSTLFILFSINTFVFAEDVIPTNTATITNVPNTKNAVQRAYFQEIVSATAPYKIGVMECYQNLGSFTGCNSGTNAIPAGITSPTGKVASLSVTNGVIIAAPVPTNVILASDTYVLTPSIVGANTISWAASGAAVDKGYIS